MALLNRNKMINRFISSKDDLKYVMDLLHDSIIEIKDIKYDKLRNVLDIIFYRPCTELNAEIKKKRFLLIFTILYYPIAKTLLHLENIDHFEIQTMEDVTKKFHFNFLGIEKSFFKMFFDPTLEIKFSFLNDIKGYLQDKEVISAYKKQKFKFREFKCFNFTLWFD